MNYWTRQCWGWTWRMPACSRESSLWYQCTVGLLQRQFPARLHILVQVAPTQASACSRQLPCRGSDCVNHLGRSTREQRLDAEHSSLIKPGRVCAQTSSSVCAMGWPCHADRGMLVQASAGMEALSACFWASDASKHIHSMLTCPTCVAGLPHCRVKYTFHFRCCQSMGCAWCRHLNACLRSPPSQAASKAGPQHSGASHVMLHAGDQEPAWTSSCASASKPLLTDLQQRCFWVALTPAVLHAGASPTPGG